MGKSPALSGVHFMLGDVAVAEGAIAAGCTFFGGYPITPSTEVAERMALRLPQIGGIFMQMEDELASIAAVLGASWGGRKSMTATSGPGFSLMMESIGLAVMTETPAVICNVQRGAPSTGLPTLVAQGDMMQARWGSHGHYQIIALVPWSPQECFDLTVRAFNLAERYRTPVLIMADAEVAHLTERVVIPPAGEIEIWPRKRPTLPPGPGALDLDETLVAPMPAAGEGYRLMVESLTHDDRGYPDTTATTHRQLVQRLNDKIYRDRFALYDQVERVIDDAEVVVVSYGISARISARAVEIARARGIKAGLLRLRTVWPFPEERIGELSKRLAGFVVAELNLGQVSREVERVAVDGCSVATCGNAGGDILHPKEILEAIIAVDQGLAPSRSSKLARV